MQPVTPVRSSDVLGRWIENGQWVSLTKNWRGKFVIISPTGKRTLQNSLYKRSVKKLNFLAFFIAFKHILVSIFSITLRKNLNSVSIGKKYGECFHNNVNRPNDPKLSHASDDSRQPATSRQTESVKGVGSSAVLGSMDEYSIGGLKDGRTILRVWENRDCKSLVMDNNQLKHLIKNLTCYLESCSTSKETRQSH
jgi:hypothetical protein